MLLILYIILIVSSLISSFATISKGAIFENKTLGGFIVIAHWMVVIALIILATINYSAIHILLMPILSIVIGWFLTYFVYTYVYHIDKNGNRLNR